MPSLRGTYRLPEARTPSEDEKVDIPSRIGQSAADAPKRDVQAQVDPTRHL